MQQLGDVCRENRYIFSHKEIKMPSANPDKKNNHLPAPIDRRTFIAASGASAMSFSLMKPQLVRGSGANSKIKLGVIGCGGRGNRVTGQFKNHGGYEIFACQDYFRDRVDTLGDEFGIPAKRRYTGLSGYKRMLEAGVDAVFIVSPPYFHPQQAQAAVDAGVHVYIAKPIAVDVPGCKSIAQSGKKATQNRLTFTVDFQTRATEFYIEAIKRVHEGAIGDIVFGESIYHARCPFQKKYEFLRDDPDDPANKLRAWGLDRALSGDIITEQNIHALDVINWIMNNADPVSATGVGGRKVRQYGTCYDHFVLIFEYPGKVGITFSSKQIEGHGTVPDGLVNRIFGSKGVLEAKQGGNVLIRGENFYRGGDTSSIGREGVDNNIATFYDSITNADFSNPTVKPSVQSNLITILGRQAAYTGEKVYWSNLIKSNETLQADLKGLKS